MRGNLVRSARVGVQNETIGDRKPGAARLRFFNAGGPAFYYLGGSSVAGWFSQGATYMTDLIYLAVTLGFFALGALYARFCETL